MSHSIGNVPISSIQNIEVSSSEEEDEIDMVDEDVNFVFLGADSVNDINIDFSLYEDSSSPRSIEEQRDEVKNLIENEDIDNTFSFSGKKGRISVQNVSFPQDSSRSNIVSGTIQGRFLPWPKHFPDNAPTILAFFSGDIDSYLNLDNDGVSLIAGLEGSLESNLDSKADLLVINLLTGDLDSSLDVSDPLLSRLRIINSSLDSSLDVSDPLLSRLRIINSSLDSSLDVSGDFSIEKMMEGGIESNFSTESELKIEKTMVGDVDSVLAIEGTEFGDSVYGDSSPVLSLLLSIVGNISGVLNFDSDGVILSMKTSTEGSVNGALSSSTPQLNISSELYGNEYGINYGGN